MNGFENSIYELSQQLASGEVTSTQLVRQALLAIAENDQDGKKLNTVSEISSTCLFEAEAADQEIRSDHIRGPLHGIPILLKDNIDVKGLHTTAGSYALNDLIADKDSPAAAKLRKAGAIIIGKSNLSEFAYWMSSDGMPCGFSSLSGQVVHAINPAFDPSGSSTGSAVAVSAGFVPAAIGSETCGSLMSPGIANAVVSLKPTVGLVSRTGVIPISHSQDTLGPIATTVRDCALLLSAMAGRDEEDPATWRIPADCCEADGQLHAPADAQLHSPADAQLLSQSSEAVHSPSDRQFHYETFLSKDLTGCRIGLYTDRSHPRTDKEELYQQKLKERIENAGGQVVEIEYESTRLDCGDILTWEFRNGINRYLASHHCRCRTLTDIIEFNKAHADRCLQHGQDLLLASDACTGMLKEADYLRQRIACDQRGKELVDDVMEKYQLDCLVTTCGSITSFAAVYGTCSMVLPAAPFNPDVYEPVSYFLTGVPFGEARMLHVAYALSDEA